MARFNKIVKVLREKFPSTTKLLGDTTVFLSTLPELFNRYEPSLRAWRKRLESNLGNVDVLTEIKQEIIHFRKDLRSQGCDASLGSFQIKLEGFRLSILI